jgi:hypothetical protein
VGHNHRFLKHADKTSLHKETTQKSAQFSNENFSHFLNFFLHSFSSASLKPYSSSHLALNSLDNALVNHTVGRQRSVTLQLPSIEEQSLLTHWHAVDRLDLFHEIENSGAGGQADQMVLARHGFHGERDGCGLDVGRESTSGWWRPLTDKIR